MRIAHFYEGIYFNGGVSLYIQSLTKLQRAAGDEVLYFELEATKPRENGTPATLVADEQALFRLCLEREVDVLHLHTYTISPPPAGLNTVYTVHEHSPHCMSGGLFLKNRGLPCPRTYHLAGCCWGHLRDHCGSVRPRKFIHNFRRVHALKKILPQMKVVCVGYFLKDRMIKAGYPDRNIQVIPNFTDIEIAPAGLPPPGLPEFLFMGRLENLKGVGWLLRSFREVRSPCLLNICGEGTDEAALKALTKEFGMEDRVRFLGWIDRDAKIRLLQGARALIVPSVWHETFGLVAIEAAACGRAVIVSNAGELPYIVENGKEGLVVEVGNVLGLRDAIEDLAGDLEKAGRLGRNNQRKCNALYTPAAHKTKLDAAYASAC